mmetsp:Transcript_40490/g.103689  ORF Transcript_40490/g.103689 Transcript_40490/m.103689 type:complete len:300 (+) Transcript_40490:169-1068(+)
MSALLPGSGVATRLSKAKLGKETLLLWLTRLAPHTVKSTALARIQHLVKLLQPQHQVREDGPLIGILAPAQRHYLLQRVREVLPELRAEPLLHHCHRRLQRREPQVGDLPCQQLPDDDPKGKHVGLVVVWLVLNDLRRHPAVRARLCRHVAGVGQHTRHTKVPNLDNAVAVHQQVGGLQVSVDDVALVKVVHAARHGQRDLHYGSRLQTALAADDVVQAAIVHVLKHDAQIGATGARARKLHDVLVPDFLHDGHLLHKLLELLRIVINVLQNLHRHLLTAVDALVQVAESPAGDLPLKV